MRDQFNPMTRFQPGMILCPRLFARTALIVFLFFVGLLKGCRRSYFDTDATTCTVGQMRCSGNKIQDCPEALWQTVDDCALYDMICTTEAGQASCVEIVDTNRADTDTLSLVDTDTDDNPPMDAGPSTDGDLDAGLDAGSDGGL